MASYKNGSITLENVYGKKTYETTIVECGSSIELQELTIIENGTYTAPEGTSYSPINVNVPSKEEETKSITITENGTTTVLPTNGKVLSKVDIVANVALEGNPMQEYVNNNGGDGKPSCYYLFYNYKGRSLDNVLKSLDTSKVTTMQYMFQYCEKLISIPEFNTSKVTNMGSMFSSCSSLATIPILNTSNVTNMSYMFNSCSNLTSIPQIDTSKVTDMSNMFQYCSNLTSIPLLDTSKVTNMERMFQNCSNLTSIPQLDTSNVDSMIFMFSSCSNLTSIPALNTSNVTNMNAMFAGCSKLTSVPELDTSKVTNMVTMFQYCNLLEKIDITKLASNNSFAYGCYSLKTLIIRTMGTIPSLNSSAFNSCYHFYGTTNATYNPEGLKDGAIYVPDDKVEALKTATNWSVFADIIKPLSTYVEV